MNDMRKISSQFFHRKLNLSAVKRLKSAGEESKAADQGMIATNTTTRAANTMKTPGMQDLETSETSRKIPSLHNKHVKEPSKDEKSVQPGSKALSSILALPTELHLQVILNLSHSIDPGLLDLREVNRYFRSIISPTDVHTWGDTLLEMKQFKAAERLYRFLRVEDRLPCTLCQCLLAKERFHMQAKQGKKALGHKLGHKRFCMDCGIKYRKYGGGNSVRVDDQADHYKIVCMECLEFLDEPEGISNCQEHFWRSDTQKQRLKLLRLRESEGSY